jgi:hypothetical protein
MVHGTKREHFKGISKNEVGPLEDYFDIRKSWISISRKPVVKCNMIHDTGRFQDELG